MESWLIFQPLVAREGVTHWVVCMLSIWEFNKQVVSNQKVGGVV